MPDPEGASPFWSSLPRYPERDVDLLRGPYCILGLPPNRWRWVLQLGALGLLLAVLLFAAFTMFQDFREGVAEERRILKQELRKLGEGQRDLVEAVRDSTRAMRSLDAAVRHLKVP